MLLALLLAIIPHDTVLRERFDTIEVQFTYSWCGQERENGDIEHVLKPVFCQLLFRRWNREQHIIDAWRMAKPEMKYGYSHARGVHEIRWFDGDKERCIETKSMVYSSADFDSELIERVEWPREWRRDLLKGRK